VKLTIDIAEKDVRRYAGYRPENWVEGSALRLVIDAARKVFPQYVEGEWYKVTFGAGYAPRTVVLYRRPNGWSVSEGGGTTYSDNAIVHSAVRLVEAQ
jgi:hypothetical protein